MAKRYVIIGDGAAGTTAARTLRQRDPNAQINVYSDDPHPAYYRAALTHYLIGELSEQQIWAVPTTFYSEFNISRSYARVDRVDVANSQLVINKEDKPVPYDQLLIATGSSARKPPFDGAELAGVMTMRTLRDVRQVMDLIKLHGLREAVIVGGGPLAMEWVVGLHERGVEVTYMLRSDHLMRKTLDKTASDLTLARMRLAGVNVITDDEIVSAVSSPNSNAVSAVKTKTGRTIPCQLVGVAIGVQCNTQFLVDSGIKLGKRHRGIVVDPQMRTSVPNIYGAGDVVELDGEVLQLWEPARKQGRTAAINMSDGSDSFQAGAHYNATRLYDLDFASVGDVSGEGATTQLDFPQAGKDIRYRKLFLRNDKLVGAIMLGTRNEKVRQKGRLFKRLIDEHIDLSALQDGDLLNDNFDVRGMLEKKALVRRPKQAQSAVSVADLIKTQMMPALDMLKSVAPAAKPRQTFNTIALPKAAVEQLRKATSQVAYLSVGTEKWTLDQQTISLGRDADDNDIPVADDAASHRHAQISRQSDGWYVRDVGSTNGTWRNGVQVTVPQKLNVGDKVQIGETELLFATETQVSVPQAQASDKSFALRGGAIIGRSASADIMLTDPTISGHHAEIVWQDGAYAIRDLGSTNGTDLNGNQIGTQPVKLAQADQLRLGANTVFKVQGDSLSQL